MYEDVDIELPNVRIPKEELDSHSQRLMKVCDLWDADISDEQIKKARRAYYGAVSYVDDCIGKLMKTLKDCRLSENTIVVFSGDHGDMLGERGLWYKMSYFESSVRVPLMVHYPKWFAPHHVSQNVSTLDILPTLVDLGSAKMFPGLPMDGTSLLPHLEGRRGHDTVFAEYAGEGTISPMMMIRRGPWKYITCPADPPQLYNLDHDPSELVNLCAKSEKALGPNGPAIKAMVETFRQEAEAKWDFKKITHDILMSQRQRRVVWNALKRGTFTSWDYNPPDDGKHKYIRSHIPLDDLELKARYPPVDNSGRERGLLSFPQAGAHGE